MITCEICQAQYNEGESCPNIKNHERLKPEAKNYSAMKKDELVALAQEREIELTGDESKAELITLLAEVPAPVRPRVEAIFPPGVPDLANPLSEEKDAERE